MPSPDAPTYPDPRLSKDADLFVYEPRTADAPAHYDRDEIIADLTAFYNFLPHVSASTIHTAPPGGWPEITKESLAAHDVHKSPEAIDLMRHLPYISGDEPWIMMTAFVCDYRRVTIEPGARGKPGWLFNAADKEWPPWTVMLTAGTDREASRYILDTTDGTITRYCAGDCGPYPPTYAADDPRSWRDRIDMETVTVKEWLGHWRKKYLDMTVLAIPPDYGGYHSPDPFFGEPNDEPGSYNYEEMHVSYNAYHVNLPRCHLPTLRLQRANLYCRECARSIGNMDGPT